MNPWTPEDVERVLTGWKLHEDHKQRRCADRHEHPTELGSAKVGRSGWTVRTGVCWTCTIPIYTAEPPAAVQDDRTRWWDIWYCPNFTPPEPGDHGYLDYLSWLTSEYVPRPGDRDYPEHCDRIAYLEAREGHTLGPAPSTGTT